MLTCTLTHTEAKLFSFQRILSFAAHFGIDLNEIEYINDAIFKEKPCQVFCVWDAESNEHYLLVFDSFLLYIGSFNNLIKFKFAGTLKFIGEEGGEYENNQDTAH